jgi:hypothetical protein
MLISSSFSVLSQQTTRMQREQRTEASLNYRPAIDSEDLVALLVIPVEQGHEMQ